MFDLAIGFVVGVAVGHFVPTLYTQVMTWIKSKTAPAVAQVTADATQAVVADVTKAQ